MVMLMVVLPENSLPRRVLCMHVLCELRWKSQDLLRLATEKDRLCCRFQSLRDTPTLACWQCWVSYVCPLYL